MKVQLLLAIAAVGLAAGCTGDPGAGTVLGILPKPAYDCYLPKTNKIDGGCAAYRQRYMIDQERRSMQPGYVDDLSPRSAPAMLA